ncbi:MAG: DUF1093 domain-containing protein [Clostridium sp.]
MKKGVMTFFLLLIIFSITGCSIKLREIGTEKYYVKIVESGEKKEDVILKDDKKVIGYYYEYSNVPAYDENGKKILVTIDTLGDKEIRKDSYLKVYVKEPSVESINEIQGFDQVDVLKIPEKAKNALK